MTLNSEGRTDPQHLLVALRHPLRRAILRLIAQADNPLSPREAADVLDRPLSNVSYHVRVLSDREMLTLARTQPVRGSMQHFYVVHEDVVGMPWVREALDLDSQK